jgi:hypothetical protein
MSEVPAAENLCLSNESMGFRSLYLPGFSDEIKTIQKVILKNGVFWDVIPCGSCKNQRLRGT